MKEYPHSEPAGRLQPSSGYKGGPDLVSALLEGISDAVILCNSQMVITEVNSAAIRLLGSDCRCFIGLSSNEFMWRCVIPIIEPSPGLMDGLKSCFFGTPPASPLELHFSGNEETEGEWMECTACPLSHGGDLMGYMIILRRITRLMKTYDSLRQREERYRLLMQKGYDGVMVFELNPDYSPRCFVEVNDVACNRLGYSRNELLKRSPLDIVSSDRIGPVLSALKGLIVSPHIMYESIQVSKDGERIPVEISMQSFFRGKMPTVLSISRDISERKRMEELQKNLYSRIEHNMEQFAILNDHLRNPLAVIVALADLSPSSSSDKIIEQAQVINGIVDQLDRGWIESEKVRSVLRKHGL